MHFYALNGNRVIPDLFTLDSGTRSPGIAAFAGKELLEADRLDVTEYANLPEAARWLKIGRLLAGFVTNRAPRDYVIHVVFERPQWYARSKSKGDPNKLAGLTGVAGVFIGVLSSFYELSVASYTPAEWIGQLSKECPACEGAKGRGRGKARIRCTTCNGSDWNTPRGRYIAKRLTGNELARVPDQNDAIDAAGIGLKAVGRLEPHIVLSNGRDGR